MSDITNSSFSIKPPKIQKRKSYDHCSIYILELIRYHSLHTVREDRIEKGSQIAAINKYRKEQKKAREIIPLNIGQKPATLVSFLLISQIKIKYIIGSKNSKKGKYSVKNQPTFQATQKRINQQFIYNRTHQLFRREPFQNFISE